MNQRTWLIIGIVVLVILISCVAIAAAFGAGVYYLFRDSGDVFPTERVSRETSEPTPEFFPTPGPVSADTLLTLENSIVPDNDPVELAERFQGIRNIPDTFPSGGPYQVGDELDFYVTDSDSNITSPTTATLEYAGDIVYFWVENGVDFEQSDLDRLARTFEDQIYPTDRNFFGSEWFPGIDNDPHIYILYTTGMGFNVAGYFSSSDELPPQARPTGDSNAHEMFLLNADNSPLYDPYTYGVLAHELQHMIHWYRDRNETSWINEGMSELATVLNDYIHTGFIEEYIFDPDLQLNDWPNDENATTPHYGAGMSFATYFLERFGNETTQDLVADVANGLDSVDNVLEQDHITDPLTGAQISADDLVLDWMITNYLGDSNVADGRYAYNQYPEVYVQADPTESIDDCSPDFSTRTVHQYGVDYIDISCGSSTTLHFEGLTQTGLLPADAYSGRYAFWSNKGDESDMSLQRAFDFTDVSGALTLTFQTWYDIEEDWDYVYLLASTDDGASWEIVDTPSGTDSNPTGNSYGWGYTGLSGSGNDSDWMLETVDLSQFAGKNVILRFEYVTDAAVNGEGFMIDDISVPETGYFEDFENGEGAWQAAGFARVENILPQSFRLALIGFGDQTTVQIIEIPETNIVDIPLDFNNVDTYTLVVTGTTRFTRQTATYRFSFQQ
ncbi:MAG TPA: hypothetical protein VLK33_08115 [Terriglobales bacterium]|nr:hypothetical protein [Terriglobales bacterium]